MSLAYELKRAPNNIFGLGEKKGQVGIEIEVPGNVPAGPVPGWSAKREGSLRRGGVEFVYDRPGMLNNVEAKVQTLNEYLMAARAKPDLDDHVGSVHIHVNVGKDSLREVFGSVIVFALAEPFIMDQCGPKRDGNYFCLSTYDTGDMFHYWKKLFRFIRAGQYYAWKDNDHGEAMAARGRYTAQNLDALPKFGSVEYRCFPLSIDPASVHKWATWCVDIHNTAKASDDPVFLDICNQALNFPVEFLSTIFGPKLPFSQRKIETYMPFGLKTAFELAHLLRRELKKEGERV